MKLFVVLMFCLAGCAKPADQNCIRPAFSVNNGSSAHRPAFPTRNRTVIAPAEDGKMDATLAQSRPRCCVAKWRGKTPGPTIAERGDGSGLSRGFAFTAAPAYKEFAIDANGCKWCWRTNSVIFYAMIRHIKNREVSSSSRQAFTLIELLVDCDHRHIGRVVVARAGQRKNRAMRIQCTSQMKQLGLGIQMFTTDHDDMFPPTSYSTGGYQYQITWDKYIHKYIGGTDSDADLILGIMDGTEVPRILKCPADKTLITISYASYGQRRTYSMNWAGPNFTLAKNSPLPPPAYGVGIYYNLGDGSAPDWEPKGYKNFGHTGQWGTILLAEEPNGRNIAGNDWPSFCAYRARLCFAERNGGLRSSG